MTNSPDDNRHPIIVRAGTLAAFLAEVPPGTMIRVMQTHRQHECFRTLFLHAQAVTASGEVAWLCEAHEVMYWQDGEPAGRQDRQIAEGMSRLHKELIARFIALGYLVQDETDYGLPGAVEPINARIGRWNKNTDGELTVTLDIGPAAAAQA